MLETSEPYKLYISGKNVKSCKVKQGTFDFAHLVWRVVGGNVHSFQKCIVYNDAPNMVEKYMDISQLSSFFRPIVYYMK